MTLIEKTLKLLDLNTFEKFNIKGSTTNDGNLVDYCVDYQGHLLYETKINGKTRLINSKIYNLVKILNGTCNIIYKTDKVNEKMELEIPTLQESSSIEDLLIEKAH